MNKLILAFLITLIFCLLSYGLEDNLTSRIEAAKRYIKVTPPMQDMIGESLPALEKKLEEIGVDKSVAIDIIKNINMKNIDNIIIQKCVEYFTTSELNALTKFYSSPEGKSIMEKFPRYMLDVQVEINKEITKAVKRLDLENK